MPARKPTELKKRLGTSRPSRDKPALVVMPATPTTTAPPDTLADAGAREWRHVLQVAPWIGASDIAILKLYCEAIDRRAHLIAILSDMGYVLYTDRGYAYLNPAAGALATTETMLTKWMSQLGLNPADRGRLGVAEVKAQSALERIRADRAKTVAG
jgi:hypothetical protein